MAAPTTSKIIWNIAFFVLNNLTLLPFSWYM